MSDSVMGGAQWANQKRRAAFALVGLEHPMDAGGEAIPQSGEDEPFYTDERIEQTRAATAHLDPNYTAVRRARGLMPAPAPKVGASRQMDITSPDYVGSKSSDAAAFVDMVENPAELLQTREQSAGEGSASEAYTESDVYQSSHPAIAGDQGFAHTTRSTFDQRRNSLHDYELGVRFLRTAGRCNHPRCQLIREKGMELTGAIGGSTGFAGIGSGDKRGIEATMPEIPSIPVDKRTYPIDPVTGKQNRKEVQITREYKPADKNHPEWAAMQQGGSGDSLYNPSDLLQHHHFEGDADFERYPLPWQ